MTLTYHTVEKVARDMGAKMVFVKGGTCCTFPNKQLALDFMCQLADNGGFTFFALDNLIVTNAVVYSVKSLAKVR